MPKVIPAAYAKSAIRLLKRPGAELAARIQKECFWHLEAPIGRIAGWDTPYPHAFEWQYFPGKKRMIAGIRSMMEIE